MYNMIGHWTNDEMENVLYRIVDVIMDKTNKVRKQQKKIKVNKWSDIDVLYRHV